jgi:hypothetical protein
LRLLATRRFAAAFTPSLMALNPNSVRNFSPLLTIEFMPGSVAECRRQVVVVIVVVVVMVVLILIVVVTTICQSQ